MFQRPLELCPERLATQNFYLLGYYSTPEAHTIDLFNG